MQAPYVVLAALPMIAAVLTGILWTALDLGYQPRLRPHLQDVRAVHFGSLYRVPWFLGVASAFDKRGGARRAGPGSPTCCPARWRWNRSTTGPRGGRWCWR
jgi:hypothetical protein